MGWFDEQIRRRKENDSDVFSDSVYDIIGSVSGKKSFFTGGNAKNEIDRILGFYGVKSRDLPGNVKDIDEQIECLIRPHGIMKRQVELKKGWHKNAVYPMLATLSDGSLAALIPQKHGGYLFADKKTGRMTKVTNKNENIFLKNAVCFYKPFPLKKLSEKELVKSICQTVSKSDIALFCFATCLAMVVSLAVPVVYKILFAYVAPGKEVQPLLTAMVFLVCISLAASLIESVKKITVGKIKNSMKTELEGAVMMRILSLPASFFKVHGAGELAGRMKSVSLLSASVAETLVLSGVTALFSLVCLIWIAIFVTPLFWVSASFVFITVLFLLLSVNSLKKLRQSQTALAAEEQEISYSLISAVSKIKLVGAQKRAFAKWGKKYASRAEKTYNLPAVVKYKRAVEAIITALSGACIYYVAAKNNLSAADFYSFTAAFGVVTASLAAFSENSDKMADIKPSIENIKTFFDAEPEISSEKQLITHISGGIELNNVSFGYDDGKNVLDNISLKIRPGEYVAVVGKTGCGKSTLIRLLLGFETPKKGAVYYDGKDLSTLDLKTLRRKIGIVLQNGKLFAGDIFSNIAISSANLTLQEAWEAAEKAGIAEDIKNMPMGMNTLVSEGGTNISGGQKQRILIARALAAKPRIIIFDEATSALDNIIQKTVSETLDSVKCTRIVVAHRLSTIEKCGRIIVLDNGKIAEDGTYDELMEKNGLFAELVSTQKI